MADDGDAALCAIRGEIDALDAELLSLLAARRRCVARAAANKAARGLPLHDSLREARMMRERFHIGHELGLPDPLVESFFGAILADSRVLQPSEPDAAPATAVPAP